MGRIAARAFAREALTDAWLVVLGNDREDGLLSGSVARFAQDCEQRLDQLAEGLADGSYCPAGLTPVRITVGDKVRELHIPAVPDRIVARAILRQVAPLVDPALGPAAFAFRAGLGVTDAVAAVTALRAEGLLWVVRTDVRECFPTLPKDRAFRLLSALVEDRDVLAIVRALLDRTYRADTGGIRVLAGVPQGCPLSPLLANLALADVDAELLRAGYPVIRYGDDVLIAAESEGDAWEALRITSKAVEGLGMELNNEKTRITTFDDGFTFLGEDFGPRYPPHLEGFRVEAPDERALYVGLQGSGIRMAQGRLIVESKDDAEVLNVASTQVARIICFGSVGVSAGVRAWALEHGVDLVLASRKGNYQGTMLSHEHRYRPTRLRAQIACADGPRGHTIARAIIKAKIEKQQVVLLRMARRTTSEAVREATGQLAALLTMLPDASTPMELMGMEGAAARFYFPCLGALMPESLRFTVRSRQPPQDVPNAALSYLYTILLGECVTALHAAGLEPALGVLHADQDNRPSLALDLMEEFRPWLVDQVVVEAARQGRLRPDHGRREEARGVLLTAEGRSVVVDAYEKRLLGETGGAIPEFAGTRRRHIYRQAQRLRASIMDPTCEWTGITWRP